MPLKDKEKYNNYMNNYQKNKRKGKKGTANKMTDDFNVMEQVQSNPTTEMDLETAKKIVAAAKDKVKDDITGESDPVFGMIEKGMKYLPVIMKAVEGFSQAAAHYQAQQPVQNKNYPTAPGAPDGWIGLSPMQRLGYKHSRPDWYAAGEAFEQGKNSGNFNQTQVQQAMNHVDQGYNPPVQHPQQNNIPTYPEPPLVSESSSTPQGIVQSEKDKGTELEIEKISNTETTEQLQKEKEEIIMSINEDNKRYLDMAFQFLNDMDMEQFKDYVTHIEKFKPKITMLKMFLPVQTKSMLINSSIDELVELFKENTAKKFKWLEKNKKIDDLKKLFEEIQETLKE